MTTLQDLDIHPELLAYINKICPEHWRTSCSDSDINNGLYSRNEDWYGRCARCNLLELTKTTVPEKLDEEGRSSLWRFDW